MINPRYRDFKGWGYNITLQMHSHLMLSENVGAS
jgi:hypothetical protein